MCVIAESRTTRTQNYIRFKTCLPPHVPVRTDPTPTCYGSCQEPAIVQHFTIKLLVLVLTFRDIFKKCYNFRKDKSDSAAGKRKLGRV